MSMDALLSVCVIVVNKRPLHALPAVYDALTQTRRGRGTDYRVYVLCRKRKAYKTNKCQSHTYTRLFVYPSCVQRYQTVHCVNTRTTCPTISTQLSASVSYTHLDVYKRQV